MLHDVQRRPRSLFDRFFSYLDRRSPSERILLWAAGLIFIGSVTFFLIHVSQGYNESTPTTGGTYVEGIIGTPRFVNPVLAITRADHDLVALVYSGLMKLNSDGELVNDLADSIDISDDGKTYHVTLKDGITFHDGTPLTADDVAFTINLIQNPELKSPLRGNWNGVTVEAVNERELNFILDEPYVPFIENFTVGIVPKHIWSTLSTEELPFSQHNTEPIGTGPYKIVDVKRNDSGLTDAYSLHAFAESTRPPHIETIVLNFYQNEAALEEAYTKNEIMGSAGLPNDVLTEAASDKAEQVVETLPRIFGVFINQNRTAALRDPAVRKALSTAIDRQDLVDTVLDGYGEPATTPLPTSFFVESTTTAATTSDHMAAARDMLLDDGWEQNDAGQWTKEIDETPTTLSISLATANSPVFEDTAEYLKTAWGALGVEVNVQLFEQADLVQAVIRPRDYEALLFGTEIGRSLDLYPFWHSSQREDPGYNIALYTNITVDNLLKDIRTTQDRPKRDQLISQAVDEITADIPAVFLFSPSFVYVTDSRVHVVPVARLSSPSERFSTVDEWYIEETSMWPIFHTE